MLFSLSLFSWAEYSDGGSSMKYLLIWYDQESEKARDHVDASSVEEAKSKGYMKYNGNPPAPMVSVVPEGGK